VVYFTLFVLSFLSATLLPMGSEALLLYDLSEGYLWYALWFVATLGNTFGSIVNYGLGYKGAFYLEKKVYLTKEEIHTYSQKFSQYGGWILLLSWLPIIGDPLTLIAGVLRYSFRYFVLIVLLAKGLRYAVVIFLYL
jgi:membrane protein YqaA with SNARE-associated domain